MTLSNAPTANRDKPMRPATPTTPARPVRPQRPERPAIPVKPQRPAMPITPARPVRPQRPATPLTPAIPIKPTQPGTNPVVPPATPTTPPTATGGNYIKDMYEQNAAAQKETLKQNYEQNLNKMEQTQRENQLRTDANLNRTNVEAQKDARNYSEVQNAYGLSSGAMAQAKLAQGNQLQKDLTLLRLAQQESDAQMGRDRNLLEKLYLSDQAKVDAENAMAAAKDLYAQELKAAEFMAEKGDFTRLGELYGLTPEEIAKLSKKPGGGWSLNAYMARHPELYRGPNPGGDSLKNGNAYNPVDRGNELWLYN